MSAVSKNRVKRLISQIGDIEDVHGEGSLPHNIATLTESGGKFDTDASNANTFFAEPAPPATTGVLDLPGLGTNYVTVSDHANLKPPYVTLMATVNFAGLPSPTWWAYMTPVAKGPNIGYESYAFRYDTATGKISFSLCYKIAPYSYGRKVVTSTTAFTSFPTGDIHLTGTYDGTTIKLYVKWGSLPEETEVVTLAYTGVISYPGGSHNDLYFGNYRPETSYQAFAMNGTLDNIALWKRALEASEVAAIYGGTGVPTDGEHRTDLISWWQMEEGSGTTVSDSYGSDGTQYHPGTYTAGGTAPDDVPGWGTTPVANFTMNAPTGFSPGDILYFVIKNGGLRQIVYDPIFEFEGSATGALTTVAGRTDVIKGTVSDDGLKIFCVIQNDYR